MAGADWESEDITVSNVRETGGYAIADLTVNAVVKLRRDGSKWVLDEVRLDDRRWESVDRIIAALEAARTRETQARMGKISRGVVEYREVHGRVPQVKRFDKLIDELSPRFLDEVIRLDAWSSEFAYQALGSKSFELRSPGSDRRLGTADDLMTGNNEE